MVDRPFERQPLPDDLVKLYYDTLAELVEEGNEAAKVAWESIGVHHDVALKTWVYNIHYNNWGTTSLGSIVKSRIVYNRIQGKK